MRDFEGFYPETNDFLMGIRFNNNKEWFHENKESYTKYLQEPIVALADECYSYMNEKHPEFIEKPKVSRINRDIRFSKIKLPYKESKWFFLRRDGSPNLQYALPTYFFETAPDWYRYGFFYSPAPADLAKYRKKADADISAFRRVVEIAEKLPFELTGDMYKRPFRKDLDEKLASWYNRKFLQFTAYGDYEDKEFYSAKLKDTLCEAFDSLYPVYSFFMNI